MFHCFFCMPFYNSRNLRLKGRPILYQEIECEELYVCTKEFGLGAFDQELVFPQCVQHSCQLQQALGRIIRLSTDEQVITVIHTVPNSDVIMQNVIHQALIVTWSI